MMNLTIMKLKLALKVEAPPKPTIESSASEKTSYEDWEYSNSCCFMIMENHMEDSIYESISKLRMQRSSWMSYTTNKKLINSTFNASLKSCNDASLKRHGLNYHCISLHTMILISSIIFCESKP